MSDAIAQVLGHKPELTHQQKLDAIADVFGQEYADNFQDPVIFMPCVFLSPTVKQFYKREFNLISRTLFVESVYRRRPTYNQSVLDEYSAVSSRKLADIQKLLTTQCDRLTHICRSNGVQLDASYMHPQQRVVPIIAGHAKTYIAILHKLDEVYQLTGTALLNGVIDGNARRDCEMLCRKAVRAFSAMLRNEILKLYKESQRMRKAMAGPDQELDKAESAHGAALAEFDASVESERTADPGAHVDPESAAKVIEDLTAQSNAGKGRRRKSDETSDPAGTPQTAASEPVAST